MNPVSHQTSGPDEEKIVKQLDNGKYLVYLRPEKHWNRKIVSTLAEANAWLAEAARKRYHRHDAFENRVSTFIPDFWRPGFSGDGF